MASIKKILTTRSLIVGFLVILISINVISNLILKKNSKLLTLLRSQILNEQAIVKDKDSIIVNQMKFDLLLSQMLNKNVCDSLIKHKSKVLLLFDGESACKVCIANILMDLNILEEKIGRDKVIIAGKFDNNKALNDYLSDINNGFKSILLKDIVNIKIDIPILFILASDYNVKFVFFVNDKEPDLRKLYIDDILTGYFLQ